jgi:hypothetical protein
MFVDVFRRAHAAHDPLISHTFSPWFSKIHFNIIFLYLYVSQVVSSLHEFFISSIHPTCLTLTVVISAEDDKL